MNRKVLIAVIALMQLLQNGFAQGTLSGKVQDKTSGELLTGAQVYIPELKKGAIVNEKGSYLIKRLPKGVFSIQVSFIGYTTITKKIRLTEGKNKMDFLLSPGMISLNPDVSITAIGYSSQHENAIKVESIKIDRLQSNADIGIMQQLSYTPGLDLVAKGPGIATPVIRGLSLNNILVLNNGVRMENYQFSENHPFLVDEAGIDKVEVIKGPASLLYGSDAIGGVINFIKERPAPVGHLQADINTAYFGNTQGIESNVGIKSSSSGFSWGLRANTQMHRDYRQADGKSVPNSRFQKSGLSAFLGSKQKYGSFFLYYDYFKNQLGLPNPAIDESNDYRPNQMFQNLDYHLISSKNKIYLNSLKLEFNASYQHNHRRLRGMTGQMVDMSLQALNYSLKAHIANTEKTSIIAGYQGSYIQNRNHPAPHQVIPDYSTNDNSLFVLAQYHLLKNLHLQSGLRYDMRNMQIHDLYFPDQNIYDDLQRYYNHLSFTLGGTYNIHDFVLIRANLASAYRSPNVAEISQSGIHGTRYELGNINLQEQKSLEADLGLHIHKKTWVFDISGFYNNIANYIYLEQNGDTAQSVYPVYQYTQNDAVIYGLECGLEYAPFAFANIRSVYNYTLGEQKNGSYLPFIPQNKLRFEIKLHQRKVAFFSNAFFKLGMTYAFAQNHPSQFETASPDYFLLNAGLGFDLKLGKQKLIVGIYGENLTNTSYIDHLSTLKDMGYYNMGRNIAVKVRIPLDFAVGRDKP